MTEKQTEQKTRDWPLKLLALVCAVMLWFYAEAEKNPLIDMQFDVPVQYINQSEDYVAENGVQSVRVTVKGKEVELSGLRSDDFAAVVDLSNAEVGTGEYKIQVEAPGRAERFTWQPAKTTLQIDRMQTKTVPVRVRTTGVVPDGSQLSSTEVVPDTVTIRGRSAQLKDIADVETESIDISSLKEGAVLEAALHIPDGITVQGAQKVAVRFVVQPERSRINAVIALRNVPDGMTADLHQTSADVTVTGNADLLTSPQELNQVQLYVDCSGLEAGQHTLPVKVEYYGQLTVQQITPHQVTVMLSAEQPDDQQNQNSSETSTSEGDLN